MQIEKDKVVGIHYVLKNPEGELIDSSEGMDPLVFLFGSGAIIPGLESEMKGKTTGDKFSAVIKPQDAYGERDDNLVQEIPREQFEGAEDIQVGMQFQVETELGALVVTVTSSDDKAVTVDGNHPMAGITLHFDVEVTEVREATAEEISHGHVHGPGGHDH